MVAVEVRRLAQSAAQASAEVKQLIEQSASQVSDGSKLVANAATKLQAILQSVQENSLLMNDISDASSDQSAAIEHTEPQASDLDGVITSFKLADADGEAEIAWSAEDGTATRLTRASRGAKVRNAARSYLSQMRDGRQRPPRKHRQDRWVQN
ncbi:MAG TPA: methyl-accepting chemotaxis protein [Devosiaceae bacterium]|nr:methyl-accepting chemotaxis protein [Devosiaceae bacterium]